MHNYNERGISYSFSSPRTPQQNGVVKRKNRTLEEMAGTMLVASGLPRNFWAEGVNTVCYILNPVLDPSPQRHPMNCYKVSSQIFPIFVCLDANALHMFMENEIQESLMKEVMNQYFLAIHQIVNPTEFTIKQQ